LGKRTGKDNAMPQRDSSSVFQPVTGQGTGKMTHCQASETQF
jgi:hypothetical protein